jgi:drug/metabolite transporter (DMT)-like permease
MERLSARRLWAIVALTLMWGMNWPMMKLSLQQISPLNFRALTMSVGAVFLFVYVRAQGAHMWPRRDQWPAIVGLAIPNVLGWHLVSIYGVAELASGRAAILGFTMPIYTVLIGIAFFGERLTPRVALACAAAAAAIVLLLWNEFSRLSGRPLGVLWMEIAAFSWALGTVLMRRRVLKLDAQVLTVWMLLLGSIALWSAAGVVDGPIAWASFTPVMWASLLYGALINYGLAQLIWFGMASHLPPATSAMSIMAIPMVGILSAPFIVGEWPVWQDWAAVAFIVVAIAAVLLPQRRAQPVLASDSPLD